MTERVATTEVSWRMRPGGLLREYFGRTGADSLVILTGINLCARHLEHAAWIARYRPGVQVTAIDAEWHT